MGIKNAIAPFSKLFSQKRLVSWTKRKTIFPFYHTISNEELPYISNLYPLRTIDQFTKDLDFLCDNYNPIHIDEVLERIASDQKDEAPAFHISFDDGLKETYEVIAPILEERNIPATFFVNTEFIDNKKMFYRYKIGVLLEHLKKKEFADKGPLIASLLKDKSKWKNDISNSLLHLIYQDQDIIEEMASVLKVDFKKWLSVNKLYLTSAQIEDLIKRGFTIGSHSKDHPRFKYLNLASQKKQIEESFLELKKHFNIENHFFSFPFGDENVSKELFDWMSNEMNCKLSFGVSGIKDDYSPIHLHRIPMDECEGSPEQFIKTEYVYYMIKSIFNRNQITRN